MAVTPVLKRRCILRTRTLRGGWQITKGLLENESNNRGIRRTDGEQTPERRAIRDHREGTGNSEAKTRNKQHLPFKKHTPATARAVQIGDDTVLIGEEGRKAGTITEIIEGHVLLLNVLLDAWQLPEPSGGLRGLSNVQTLLGRAFPFGMTKKRNISADVLI